MGGEALSRWQHPAKGLLNPGRYIPLLEREDRIGRLDMYNLEKACALLQRLHEAGKEDFISLATSPALRLQGEKMVEPLSRALGTIRFFRAGN